jgi:putative transposase
MSKKRITYSTEFKTKVVLEVLKNEKSVNEIAVKYNITQKNIQNWKTQFLANAEMAMEPSKVTKEYKTEIAELKAKNDEYAKVVGKLTVERDWLSGKLESLDLSTKKDFVDVQAKKLSISRQCELLKISRSSIYYKPLINEKREAIINQIENIFNEIPTYGYLKVHQKLLEDGFDVCPNTVHKYRKNMSLRAILAVKKPKSTKDKYNPIHSYKINSSYITEANQVWSTDITYIKIKGGFVYLAAIIDWYSKAILSYKVSNTMDSDLVMSVLDEAISVYGKPKMINTDQGSQYTSNIHIETLKSLGIEISMNSAGRSTDNICIERFWRTAKVEQIYLNEYNKISQLKEDIKEYIEFYNTKRFHQSLSYKRPMAVYLESLKTKSYISFTKNVA